MSTGGISGNKRLHTSPICLRRSHTNKYQAVPHSPKVADNSSILDVLNQSSRIIEQDGSQDHTEYKSAKDFNIGGKSIEEREIVIEFD
jgi:hypothetical protein